MRKHGIERQTLSIAIIPILVLAVMLEGYFTYIRFSDLDRALFARAKLIVHQLASSSEYPVFSGNFALLQQQIDSSFAQQDVNSIAVLDANSKFLAGAGAAHTTFDPEHFAGDYTKSSDSIFYQQDNSTLRMYQPIVATQIKLDELGGISSTPNKALGVVLIEISKSRLNAEKIEMLGFNLFLLLLVLLTTMLIAMRVSRRITWPVMQMSNAIRRIGEGHLETRIAGNDVRELDALAFGINDMAYQLLQDRNTLQQRIDEATQELRKKKEEAEKANFDKSRFLAAASHDLRQPMHALGLFVGELHNHLETPEQRKIASKVEESVEALSGLLDSLLDISKLDAGVVVPQIQVVDLDVMIKRIAQDFAPVALRKNITLHARPLEAQVMSDPVLLERILLNLLSNAIRYTPQNGSVLLACRRSGDLMRIEVRDNGIGIPEEEQQNVFREFVQLANSARDRSKGLGLGLAIVERLSRLLHHPLSLRSEPGKGSTFAVTMPRVFDVEDLLSDRHEPSSIALPRVDRLEGMRVLVVDDDVLVRTSTAGILESWGCEVEMGEGVESVWNEFGKSPFDLVICDYRLPDGNGLQLADRISQSCNHSPAFVLISGDTSPDILQAVNDKGLHLLHKPVRPAKLRSLILFLLKQREAAA